MDTTAAPLPPVTPKIETGATKPGVGWENVPNDVNGIRLRVDTSTAGFTETPHYSFSVLGRGAMWETTGTACVYNPTAKEFHVYLRYASGNKQLRVKDDEVKHWYVSWTGIGR